MTRRTGAAGRYPARRAGEARVPRRARLRVQVEHGVDARRPRLYEPRSRAPEAPPPSADLRPPVCLDGELRAAALTRRGRARQGFAPRQDARRRLATVRQPSRA